MARGRWLANVVGFATAGLLAAAAAASGETLTFTLPADPTAEPFQRWTVPAGVCSATFDLFGAEGSSGAHGGAEVTTTLPVVPGTAYDIYVGGQGYLGKAGYNGGGAAGNGAVGGGGGTDVRDGPGFADRVLVAGGGAGNSGYGEGLSASYPGGLGGSGGLLGENGTMALSPPMYSGGGAGGGTANAGGAAGPGGPGPPYNGSPGNFGVGGAGGLPSAGGSGTANGGGGGGGGFYGGGGGGAGGGQAPGGGGGGGSSLTRGGTVSMLPHSGNGKAIITYTPSSCAPGNGPGSGPGSTADTTKPALGALSFSSTAFRAARSGGSVATAQVGTDVSFSLSEASAVKFTVQRRATGRRVRRKCRTTTDSNRRAEACTLWKAVRGSFTVAGTGGTNSFKFRGRIGGKSLKPGSYRLSGQATDPAKNASLPTNKSFRIVR
jgi:hypothetical protein